MGKLIVVAHDEKFMEEIYKLRVERMKYETAFFNDPTQALDFFKKHVRSVDLVILDYKKPCITGLELAKQIHGLKPALPIIIHGVSGKAYL